MASADKPVLPDLAALPGEAPATPALRGVDVIKDELSRLPPKPGVYRMIGADGAVLYVGKARNLRARVSQYAQGRAHANQIYRMIQLTAAMEFIVTATETEALLLETNLIKRLKPRFNVLMRDDKSFPFIAIRTDHPAPALQKHRGAKNFKGEFYGPFASANAVNRTLNTLQKAFLLRSCSDSVFAARSRPCMLYQIKRCSAPCTGLIGDAEYNALVADAETFLDGRSADLQDRLAADMRAASEALEFEAAARFRNRIRALAAVRATQGVNPTTFTEADVFAIHQEGGFSCVQVFFFRAGQNWGNRAYFPRHEAALEPAEILEAFIAQFYDDREPPKLVLVNVELPGADLLEEALCIKAGCKMELRAPQRGEKKDIVDGAALNAREALGRRMAETQSVAKLLDGVAETFGLPQRPERIEVYDNSHIQGTNAVGAMIVAGPDGFIKGQYRKFNIKSTDLTPGDDYAMMREVLTRRFARMLKEQGEGAPMTAGSYEPKYPTEGEPQEREDGASVDGGQISNGGVDFSKERDGEKEGKFAARPDLVLIDGGEGQLAAAQDAVRALGLENQIVLVGVAKGVDRDAGRERFFMPGKAPFRLEEKSPVLYYLQRLRDEAHRFAIGAHRQRRKQELTKNPLDEIGGVGPARKRALLDRFGSARGVAGAALSELQQVEGVNRELAQRIYSFFNERKRPS
jgi:excinuclease ABC subunit C